MYESFLGQPPLQYYTRAIEDQNWTRVDVITNGLIDDDHALNPVVMALEDKVANGELPGNIFFHKVRPTRALRCAERNLQSRGVLLRFSREFSCLRVPKWELRFSAPVLSALIDCLSALHDFKTVLLQLVVVAVVLSLYHHPNDLVLSGLS